MSKHSVFNASYLLIKYEYIICTIDLETKGSYMFLGLSVLIYGLMDLLPRRKKVSVFLWYYGNFLGNKNAFAYVHLNTEFNGRVVLRH